MTRRTELSKKEFDFLLSVGGKPISRGRKTLVDDPSKAYVWNFGLLVNPDKAKQPDNFTMTKEQVRQATRTVKVLPKFEIKGRGTSDANKVILSDVFKHPLVKDSKTFGGKVFPGFTQVTGSCVGCGSGYAATVLSAIEVVDKGEPEEPVIVWWPYSYGRGRFRGGMTRVGDGSFSEAQVEAFNQDGILRCDEEGLPQYTDKPDGLAISSSMEMQWSDGDSPTVMPWVEKGRKNLIRTIAPCRNADDGREAIRNGYPILWCGSWGGLMKCPIKEGVLLNRKSGTWMHNETGMAWADHPKLGQLFGIRNQWGNAHGTDPFGLPVGAFWINEADFNLQCRGGSCFIISNLDGFPARDINIWYA